MSVGTGERANAGLVQAGERCKAVVPCVGRALL